MLKHKSLILIIFGIFTLAPLIFVSLNGVTDPFLHEQIASLIHLSDWNSANLNDPTVKYYSGFAFLITIFSQVTSISPLILQFLPIAGIIFILSFLFTARKFISKQMAMLATAIFIWIFVIPNNYSIWPHAFGFIQYLLFIGVYVTCFQYPQKKHVIVLVLLFFSTHFYSYSSELWMLSLIILSTFFLITLHHKIKFFLSLLIFCLVMFLGFNSIVYGDYLVSSQHVVSEGYYFFTFDYFLSTLFKNSVPMNYLYSPPSYPILSLLGYLRFLLFTIPIFLYMLYILSNLILKKYSKAFNKMNVIIISIILIYLIDIFSYISAGATVNAIILRYIYFIAPLISIVCMSNLLHFKHVHFKKISLFIYGILLLCMTFSYVTITFQEDLVITSSSHYYAVDESGVWFFNYKYDVPIISDHHTVGRYSIMASNINQSFNAYSAYYYFDAHSYDALVNSSYSKDHPSYFTNKYVIINMLNTDKKTMGDNWLDFEPLSKYLNNICINLNLIKIYDGGYVWILSGRK